MYTPTYRYCLMTHYQLFHAIIIATNVWIKYKNDFDSNLFLFQSNYRYLTEVYGKRVQIETTTRVHGLQWISGIYNHYNRGCLADTL